MKLSEQELKMINTSLKEFVSDKTDFIKDEDFNAYLHLMMKIKTAIKNKVFD